MNTIGTGSLNGGTENSITKINESLTKNPITQSPGLNSGAGIGGNKTNDYNGMTQEQKEKSMVEQQVNITYNNVKNTVTKAKFLQVIAEDFGGTSSYAYKYAQTLSFENSSSTYNANHGGLGTTSSQTGLTGQALEESTIRGEVKTDYNIYKYYGVTKTEFLNEIIRQYGKDSYAHKYAQTLNY